MGFPKYPEYKDSGMLWLGRSSSTTGGLLPQLARVLLDGQRRYPSANTGHLEPAETNV